MSSKISTEEFYKKIMEKLIEKMKEVYNNEGIGEEILNHIKKVIIYFFSNHFRFGKKK